MKIINTENAPKAVGPYSQAIEHNGMIFCSGQVGIDPKKGQLVKGIEKQTKQAVRNLENVLISAGLSLNNIIKTTIFLADINDYKKINEIYGSFFNKNKPARSTVQVAALPLNARVEIEAIAVK